MYKYFIFSCKYIINSGSIFEHHNITHISSTLAKIDHYQSFKVYFLKLSGHKKVLIINKY